MTWFKLHEYYQKAMNYSLMIIVTVPLQIYLLVQQTEYSGTQVELGGYCSPRHRMPFNCIITRVQ
jgi:hypothetical protein